MSLSNLITGDDWKFTMTVTQPNGALLDITGASVWLTFKSSLALEDNAAEFQVKNLDVQAVGDNDPTNGIAVLTAAWDSIATGPPDSTLVSPGKYFYDFQFKSVAGEITTIESGNVNVVNQVTKAT